MFFLPFGLGIGDQPALLFGPLFFQNWKFGFGRAFGNDDARSYAAMSGKGFVVSFTEADLNNMDDDRRAALFKPGDPTAHTHCPASNAARRASKSDVS